jgi:hypothetical protein
MMQCYRNNSVSLITKKSEFILIYPFDSIISNYILDNKAKTFSLFIDKKAPDSYRLTIGEYYGAIDSCVLNLIERKNGKQILVLTGLEDVSKGYCLNVAQIKKNTNFEKSISIILDTTNYYIVKGDNQPFIDLRLLPTVTYKFPVIQ